MFCNKKVDYQKKKNNKNERNKYCIRSPNMGIIDGRRNI